MSSMRLSLWSGLLETVIYNQNRQQNLIRLFESGFCFFPDETSSLKVRQKFFLGGIISGLRFEEHWDLENKFVDFYDAKGDIESILEFTGKLNKIEFRKKYIPSLHPGQSAVLYLNEELVGIIGMIHPVLKKKN